ncbi:efflux RND transporter periplasmic adaptor subunit [Phorcysia thermohydrogeniphila]|uniref:RND family efflux transporter MFP subunit n=1 Tax=Phorcysia thermohydrogeniphila TaxID=936138 RepID=A0A4R1GBK9_9BACT|nr:efflux RND transporter periplasmic adaptor subunit [Phorcysia thermohydrogeniphila]TCK05424.1 RND family efflux transporter MFP subunit [Phorcysia thermohydrogeniphila]
MARRLLIAAALLLAVSSCGSEESSLEPLKVKTVTGVKTATVQSTTVEEKETFSGTVIPDQEIFISPKVVGYLIEVKATPGKKVKKGEVLAVIDSSDIRPDVEKAKAGIKEIEAALKEISQAMEEVRAHRRAAEANLLLAEKTYRRFEELLKADAVSKQKFDEVKTQYEAAKANLEAVKAKEAQLKEREKALLAKKEQIEADLKKASAYLSYTYLKSPVDGVVLQKLVDSGNLVSPQTPVFKIGTYPLKVRAFIDNTYAGKIHVGDKVTVKVKGLKLVGTVSEVDRSSDPVSHKFGVKVTLPEAPNVIPGTYAVIEFPISSRKEISIPASAVYRVGSLEYVFVIENGTAHLRLIKTGKRKGDRVTVISGLHEGETIAVSGVSKLCDGAKVEG